MEHRILGKSGLAVSSVGLGCNNFGARIDLEASRRVIHKAIDLGITLFDTADTYGKNGESETIIGQCLGDRRKEIVLATKFGNAKPGAPQGASRRDIMMAVEASLRRLRTDWIDLYQIHRPDPLTPIEETLRALDDLVRHGKVRYIGCSKLAAWQVVEAQWTSRHHNLHAFISSQNEYSLLKRGLEKSLVPALHAFGLSLIPHSPLAGGLLTGKYKKNAPLPEGARLTKSKSVAERWLNESNWSIVESLADFSRQRGHSLLDLSFSWLVSHPLVASVIAGATKPEQLELNVGAVNWALTAEDLNEIDRLTLPA